MIGNRVKIAAALAVCAVAATGSAPIASAKTTTLHFFSWMRFEALYDHYGYALKINDSTPLLAGERYIFVSDDFTGTHLHHARRASGSDHVDCAIVKREQGLCSVRIVLGHSTIRGERFPLYFRHRITRLHITGGTGRYRGARGTITANTPSPTRPGTDLTLQVTT